MLLSDAFWVSLAPTLAILATGAVAYVNEKRKAVLAASVATQTAVVAQRTEVVAIKAEEISRRAEEVRETLATTSADTNGKLQVIHELVNDRLSKAMDEIRALREALAISMDNEARTRDHAAGKLYTRSTDRRRPVMRVKVKRRG